MRYITICFVVISTLLIGCSRPNKEVERVLLHAEKTVDMCKDSAIVAFKMLSDLDKEVATMSEKQAMRYYLIRAKAQNQAYIDFTSDSIEKCFVRYYDSNGTSMERMQAHYLLGCVYRDLRETPLALQCYHDATLYAEDSPESFDLLDRIHGQMAYLYGEQALVHEQIDELDSAAHYAFLIGDSVSANLRINQKAAAYNLINKQDSALFIKDSIMRAFMRRGDIQYAAQISGNNFTYLLEQGNLMEVKKRMDFYERQSGYFHEGEIERGKEVYYYNKGRYYLAANKTDSAEVMFRKCLPFIDDPNTKIAAYHGLSLLYDQLNIADSTAKYALLAYEANDSAYQINVSEKALNIKSLYNYSQHQNAAIKSLKERNAAYHWLIMSMVTIIVLITIGIYSIKRIRKRNLQRQQMMQELYETEKMLLQNEKKKLSTLLEEKELVIDENKETYETRKRELSLEIENKQKEIYELQDRVARYEKEQNVKDEAEMEEHILHSKTRELFAYYVTHVKETPPHELWSQLTALSRERMPKLYLLLKNKKVSEREKRITLLTRLGFKPGEIAVLTGCSFPDVSLTRSRLLKKIYGIDGRAADFDKRIMLIY